MSYKLNPELNRLGNLRQQMLEVPPYQKNLIASVRNIKSGLQSELLLIEISLHEKPFVVVGLAFKPQLDYFTRAGSLLTILNHLENSPEYAEAIKVIEPLEEEIRIAEEEEQALQNRMNQAAAALREAEAIAVEKARKSPEVVNAQKALAAVEALKK